MKIGMLTIVKNRRNVTTLFIGALKKEKKKENEKANQYKLKWSMAITIGLIMLLYIAGIICITPAYIKHLT